MEIKYSNFQTSAETYGDTDIVGIYDDDSNYIYNNFYDIKEPVYNNNITVHGYLLYFLIFKRKYMKEIFEYFQFDKNLIKKKMSKLSSSELMIILYIKLLLNNSKVIIFDNIDSIINNKLLKLMFNLITLNDKQLFLNKKIIFVSNNIDNIVYFSDRIIVIENGIIKYNGSNINELPIETDIKKFINEANKAGIKLELYKDRNDLLKAIYRSVKK